MDKHANPLETGRKLQAKTLANTCSSSPAHPASPSRPILTARSRSRPAARAWRPFPRRRRAGDGPRRHRPGQSRGVQRADPQGPAAGYPDRDARALTVDGLAYDTGVADEVLHRGAHH